jgi:hypothetical protein
MFGLVAHPERYHRLTRRVFGRLHARITADVTAAGLAAGGRLLDVGTGPACCHWPSRTQSRTCTSRGSTCPQP